MNFVYVKPWEVLALSMSLCCMRHLRSKENCFQIKQFTKSKVDIHAMVRIVLAIFGGGCTTDSCVKTLQSASWHKLGTIKKLWFDHQGSFDYDVCMCRSPLNSISLLKIAFPFISDCPCLFDVQMEWVCTSPFQWIHSLLSPILASGRSDCLLVLTNDGITVIKDVTIVEFASTGNPKALICIIDNTCKFYKRGPFGA